MRFFIIFCFVVLFGSYPRLVLAAGCDYTVGQNEQFTTIKAALEQAEKGDVAGKTICVKNDKTYTDKIVVSKSGQPGNPFTIKKHPDSATKPKIRDNTPFTSDSYGYTFFHIRGASHVVVEDLEIERSAGVGMQASNASHVTLKNITVHDTLNSALKLLSSEHSVIEGCTVYGAAWAESPQCMADPVCEAVPSKVPATVNMIDSNNTTLQNCTIFNTYGNVLSSVKSENTKILNNTVYDSFRPLIHIDQASKITIENNLVYNTNNPNMPKVTSAFYKLDEYYDQQTTTAEGTLDFRTSTGHDRVIRNNIFLNMETGIHLGPCESSMECVLKNDIIKNNTVLNIEEDTLIIAAHAVVSNNTISHNIFDTRTTKSNGRIAYSAVNSGIAFGPNIWSKTPPDALKNAGDSISASRLDIQNYFVHPEKVLNQTMLVPGQVDPNWYAVKPEFSQFGADTSRVGAATKPATTPPTSPKNGDVNGDGAVNVFDYNIVLRNFGQNVTSRGQGDLTGNGVVDIFDHQQVISNFGT